MKQTFEPNIGNSIVLEPAGLLGQVVELDDSREHLHFVAGYFDQWIPVTSSRLRPIISSERANALVDLLCRAKPISGLTRHDEQEKGWEEERASRLLDDYLAGNQEQRITALATMIDWGIETQTLSESSGLWRGRLLEARGYLLGEIAAAWGRTVDDTEKLIFENRRLVATTELASVGIAATPAEPPQDDLVLEIGDLGRYLVSTLGREEIASLTIAPGGWELPALELEIPEKVSIRVGHGRWNVWLIIQDAEDAPDELKQEMARFDEKEEWDLFFSYGAVHRRSWLILAHNACEVDAPRPKNGATPSLAELVDLVRAAPAEVDIIEVPELVVPYGDELLPMRHIDTIDEVWGGHLAVLTGSMLTVQQAHAIRSYLDKSVCVWPWGVVHQRPRFSATIFAAGPVDEPKVIAIPAPPY